MEKIKKYGNKLDNKEVLKQLKRLEVELENHTMILLKNEMRTILLNICCPILAALGKLI